MDTYFKENMKPIDSSGDDYIAAMSGSYNRDPVSSMY